MYNYKLTLDRFTNLFKLEPQANMITPITHTQANIFHTSPQRRVNIVCACRLRLVMFSIFIVRLTSSVMRLITLEAFKDRCVYN